MVFLFCRRVGVCCVFAWHFIRGAAGVSPLQRQCQALHQQLHHSLSALSAALQLSGRLILPVVYNCMCLCIWTSLSAGRAPCCLVCIRQASPVTNRIGNTITLTVRTPLWPSNSVAPVVSGQRCMMIVCGVSFGGHWLSQCNLSALVCFPALSIEPP